MTIEGSTRAAINVTPLIDILLVLLIVFMVITPLASHGISAALPMPASQDQRIQETPLVLHVGQNGKLSLNGEAISRDDLRGRLESIYASRGVRQLFIMGDGDVEFRDVVWVMDAAQGLNLSLQFGLLGTAAKLR